MTTGKNSLRVACVQTNAGENFDHNLQRAIRLAHEAGKARAELIAFPEMFLYRGAISQYPKIARESKRVIHKFQHIAKLAGVSILMGSVLEKSSHPGKYYNTSFFISKSGNILTKYRKIHLFDVRTPDQAVIQESQMITPGRSPVVVSDENVRLGFSICFDLRFPDQYQILTSRGAQVIFVPSNFLHETGKAHWHSLIRARAIENQAFIVAPAQVGTNPDSGRKSFGHSLIVGPWGEILAEGSGTHTDVIVANLDLNSQSNLRSTFPLRRILR